MPSVAIIPRIATTTKSSINVKPSLLVFIKFFIYSIVTVDTPLMLSPEQAVT